MERRGSSAVRRRKGRPKWRQAHTQCTGAVDGSMAPCWATFHNTPCVDYGGLSIPRVLVLVEITDHGPWAGLWHRCSKTACSDETVLPWISSKLRFIAGKNDGNLCNRWGKGEGKFSGNIAWPSAASSCDGQRKVALRVDASRYNSGCRHSASADEERCLMGKTDDGMGTAFWISAVAASLLIGLDRSRSDS